MADTNKNINFKFNTQSQLPEVSQQLKDLIALIEQQGAVVKATNAAYQQQTAIVNTAMGSIVSANNAIAKSLGLSTAEQKKQTTAIEEAGKAAVLSANQQIAATNAAKTAVTGLSDSMRNIATLVGIGFSVNEIKSFVNEVIDAKSKIDFFKIGLDNIIGSERAVAAVYGDLVRIAKTTPFSIEDLSKTTLALSAMGVSTNALIPTIERLGDVAALAGSDKLPRIAKAYTDVMNKGILMKQEINQFSENSIPIYNMLAVSMEKTRDEVVKLAEDHKIGFADVEKAFKKATEEGGKYYNMAITQSQTLGGRMKNLTDTIVFAKAAVGDFYEDQLSDMIDGFVKLTQVLGGSESAIDRTMSVLKSFAAVILTYTVATKGALIVEEALAAARVIQRTAISVYIALIGASTAATEGFTASQISAGVAMRANPFGLIITLVGAATAAYYAFDAATKEVVSSLGEEEIKLKNQKQLLNDSVNAVTAQAMGTEKRASAMRNLISQYPEYFSGLSAETTNNAVLNGILQKVNLSYEARMMLARNAYQSSKFEEQRIALLKEEDELMERIKKRSPELYAQVGGDVNLLMAKIKEGGSAFLVDLDKKGGILKNVWDNALNGTILSSAVKISKSLKDVDAEILKHSQQREDFGRVEKERAINIETQRWVEVANQMKKGTREYDMQLAEHEKRMRQLSGETEEYVSTVIEPKKQKAKKTTLEMSLENDVQEIKSMEKTYMNKLKLLDSEEKLEVEKAKRTITNRVALEERLESIQLQYISKRQSLMTKEIDSLIDYDMKELKQTEAHINKLIKLREDEASKYEDLTLFVYGLQEKERKENEERSIKSGEKLLSIARKTQDDILRAGALDAAENKKFWETKESAVTKYWLKVTEQEINGYEAERQRLADHMQKMLELYGGDSYQYKDGLSAYLMNEQDLTEAQNKYQGFLNKSSDSTMSWASTIVKLFDQAFEGIFKSIESALEQIDSAYENSIGAYDGFVEANRRAMDEILKSTAYTYDQKEELLKESLRRESAMLFDIQQMEVLRDRNASYMKELRDGAEEVSKTFSAITSALNGDIGSTISSLVGMFTDMSKHWREQIALQDEQRHQQRVRMHQDNIYAKEREIDVAYELMQQKFAMWDEELAKYKAIKDEEIQKLRETADEQIKINQQFSSDNQLRLQEDENFRRSLMEQGEAREIASLEASRARLIAEAQGRAASAQEIADINQAFDKLVTDKHAEYADARGNKTKEISLANQEQKAKESDYQVASEKWVQTETEKLMLAIANMAAQVSADKQNAQKEYSDFVLRANAVIFEQEKNMAIEQIKVEIAILKSKRSIFNKGKIDEAIGDLEAAINDISGINNPYGNVDRPSRPVVADPPGTPPVTDPPTRPEREPERGSGRQPRYHGDEGLQHAGGRLFSRDSIPINANWMERIVPTEDNLRLIRMVGKISNQKLVDNAIELHSMKRSYPEMFQNGSFQMNNLNILKGLPGLMSLDYSKLQTMGTPVMNFDQREVVNAIDRLSKKPVVNISVSPNGARTEEIRGNHKKVHEQSFRKSL